MDQSVRPCAKGLSATCAQTLGEFKLAQIYGMEHAVVCAYKNQTPICVIRSAGVCFVGRIFVYIVIGIKRKPGSYSGCGLYNVTQFPDLGVCACISCRSAYGDCTGPVCCIFRVNSVHVLDNILCFVDISYIKIRLESCLGCC